MLVAIGLEEMDTFLHTRRYTRTFLTGKQERTPSAFGRLPARRLTRSRRTLVYSLPVRDGIFAPAGGPRDFSKVGLVQ